MCVWNVSEKDRLCNYCSFFGGCENRTMERMAPIDGVLSRYVSIMSDIVGENILRKTHLRRVVWPRNMVVYRLKMDGYSYGKIGEAMKFDHSTAIHSVHRMRDMLKYSWMYEEEMSIWNEFNKRLESCGTKS